MTFLELVRREMHGSLPKLLFMSALGGISTATILASINAGMQGTGDGNKPSLWAAMLFIVSLFLFIKTQFYVTITATAEIEAIIHKPVSYTHLRAHETVLDLVCRLLLEKKK